MLLNIGAMINEFIVAGVPALVLLDSWLGVVLKIIGCTLLIFFFIGLIDTKVKESNPKSSTWLGASKEIKKYEPNPPASSVTKDQFDFGKRELLTLAYVGRCANMANSIMKFTRRLEANAQIMDIIKDHEALTPFDDGDANMPVNQRLGMVVMLDMVRAYTESGHQFRTPNASMMSISVLTSLMFTDQIGNLATEQDVDYHYNVIMRRTSGILRDILKFMPDRKSLHGVFNISQVLNKLERDIWAEEYLGLLRAFVELSAEGQCGSMYQTQEFVKLLDEKKGLYTAPLPTIDDTGGTSVKATPPQKFEEAIAQLNNLVGLDEVKNEVTKLANFVKIQREREKQRLKCSPISYHCVFTGNPGTGKTTVARIIASIYKSLGILKRGHLVETDRSGLVAEYIGQTAVKTNKIIDAALDGVLFIDEAYSLAQGGSRDYGIEAIATLLKRMEDNRDRLVVVLAGYKNEMQTFINANPGLESRFNRYIDFADYSAEELMNIFRRQLAIHDYHATPEALEWIAAKLTRDVAAKDENFGNARHVRNLFEKTLENQATRLASASTSLSRTDLQTILPADVPA